MAHLAAWMRRVQGNIPLGSPSLVVSYELVPNGWRVTAWLGSGSIHGYGETLERAEGDLFKNIGICGLLEVQSATREGLANGEEVPDVAGVDVGAATQ